MNKVFLAIVVTLLIGNLETDAQVKRSRPKQKQLIAAPAKTPLPAEYEINAVVVKGLGVLIVGISPLPNAAISNEKAFKSFFKDFYGVNELSPKEQRALPKVVVKFGDEDDIQTIVNAVKFVYVSGKQVVELENLLDMIRIFVVPEPNEDEQVINVRPNPLTLLVTMNDQGNLTLNNEDIGKISDLSRLSDRLREIYRSREENGVFRENSNEIEKTISIKMPLTASAGDLSKIAKALRLVGADRIGFELGDPIVTRRDLILDLPMGPPPRKKPNK